MVRSEQGRKSLLEDDIAVAAHTDLKPITRFFDSGGHDFDEGVLRQALVSRWQYMLGVVCVYSAAGVDEGGYVEGGLMAPVLRAPAVMDQELLAAARLGVDHCFCSSPCAAPRCLSLPAKQLAKQQAELCAAQQEGWIPPLGRLGSLLPCFAPPEGGEEQPQGALSTATSGLTTMDTDEGSGELEKAATAAAAALASQEELEAAAAAAEAARQARREQRRAEKERRRQQLLQVGSRLCAAAHSKARQCRLLLCRTCRQAALLPCLPACQPPRPHPSPHLPHLTPHLTASP